MPLPSQSLVKYDNPVLLADAKKAKAAKQARKQKAGDKAATAAGLASTSGASAPPAVPQTDDILNSIMPPREFEEDGQKWVQFVSAVPATRLDVINLQEQLDIRLQQRQARETGICPVREELYAQSFDEIIRQVTVNCAERGLLLLRVRDEIRMTLAAYRTLYESSVAFGMRKALQAEQTKVDMNATIRNLERDRDELEHQVQELTQKCETIERREADRRAADEKKHADEIEMFKKTHVNYTMQLQNLINPGKAH